MTYAHPRNTSVMHAAERIESVRQLSNDERRADWAAKFYARGLHRANGKPRIRVTVPSPLCQREPVAHAGPPTGTVRAAPASVQAAGNPLPVGAQVAHSLAARAGRQSFPTGDAA